MNLSSLLSKYNNENITIMQIGGMDGVTYDPIYPRLRDNWKLIVLEPIPYQYAKLHQAYINHKNVTTINKALNYHNNSTKMYTFKPEEIVNSKAKWFNGISSFYPDRNSISKKYWSGRGKKHRHINYNEDVKDNIIEVNVDCITIEEIIAEYSIEHIHVLQSDTEGFDYHVINIVMDKFTPEIINFEWNNLPKEELEKCKQLLYNYDVQYMKQDAICKLR